MFTFGRDHEIKHATDFVGSPEKAQMLKDVINAVHDIIEGERSPNDVLPIFKKAFIEGKSGVWETTGSWIRKLGQHYPETKELWKNLAIDSSATTRYRVACHLDEMPSEIVTEIGQRLAEDKSKRVSSMALARLNEKDSYKSNQSDAQKERASV